MNNNKLIAEFMGVVFRDDENKYYDVSNSWYGDALYYHTSWNWLMPVVEKCLTTDGKHYKLNDALLTCNIKEVYKTVVEFIKENE